jgi:3-hydroxymyristoyl/3-hydroxydecanoyl-(acyl carrier protein) dehydratase
MTMRKSIAAAHISGPLAQPDGSSAFEFRFSKDDPTFAGHFPMRPILPGVFQLEMARMAAERVVNQRLGWREISKAKFLRPILPDELVRLELKLSEKDHSIHVRALFSIGGRPAGETLLVLWRIG